MSQLESSESVLSVFSLELKGDMYQNEKIKGKAGFSSFPNNP